MDRRSTADARLTRSASVVESGTIISACSRWKPTETQKRILESLFASGTRNPSMEHINRITAELLRHGPGKARMSSTGFRMPPREINGRKKRQNHPPNGLRYLSRETGLCYFVPRGHLTRALYRKRMWGIVARRNSSVDPSEIRTLDLFPLHPGK